MEAKGSFSVILLVIIAVLALTLAGLTGYVFFSGPTKSASSAQPHEMVRPADDELVVKKLFESKNLFNLKNTDDKKTSVIQANIELVYLKKVSGVKNVEEKIKSYDGAIKELIITYFQNMTLEDVKQPQTKENAKKELVKQLNELLSSSEKEQKNIIFTINFNEWFYQ